MSRLDRRRFPVLFLTALLSCLQIAVWSNYGPIAQSVKAAYGWDDSTVNLMVNLGNATTLLCLLPAAYIMDSYGLKTAMTICSLFVLLGNALKAFGALTTSDGATGLIIVCQILNGIGGTAPFAAPPLVAEQWFPPEEDVFATAVTSVMPPMGFALSFVLGPNIVDEPTRNYWELPANATDIDTIRRQINYLNYIELACAFVLFVCIALPESCPCCPYPTRPYRSPKGSTGVKLPFRPGLLDLLAPITAFARFVYCRCLKSIEDDEIVKKYGKRRRKRQYEFWRLALSFAVLAGVFGVWSTLLDQNLTSLGISQIYPSIKTEAGWLGFAGNVGGAFLGCLLGWIVNHFKSYIQDFLVADYFLLAICTTLFTITRQWPDVIPSYKVVLFVTCVGSGVFLNAAFPLFFEVASQAAFPTAEGTSGSLLSMLLNLAGVCFVVVSMIPNIGVVWMNWTLVGVVIVSMVLLIARPVHLPKLFIAGTPALGAVPVNPPHQNGSRRRHISSSGDEDDAGIQNNEVDSPNGENRDSEWQQAPDHPAASVKRTISVEVHC